MNDDTTKEGRRGDSRKPIESISRDDRARALAGAVERRAHLAGAVDGLKLALGIIGMIRSGEVTVDQAIDAVKGSLAEHGRAVVSLTKGIEDFARQTQKPRRIFRNLEGAVARATKLSRRRQNETEENERANERRTKSDESEQVEQSERSERSDPEELPGPVSDSAEGSNVLRFPGSGRSGRSGGSGESGGSDISPDAPDDQ